MTHINSHVQYNTNYHDTVACCTYERYSFTSTSTTSCIFSLGPLQNKYIGYSLFRCVSRCLLQWMGSQGKGQERRGWHQLQNVRGESNFKSNSTTNNGYALENRLIDGMLLKVKLICNPTKNLPECSLIGELQYNMSSRHKCESLDPYLLYSYDIG